VVRRRQEAACMQCQNLAPHVHPSVPPQPFGQYLLPLDHSSMQPYQNNLRATLTASLTKMTQQPGPLMPLKNERERESGLSEKNRLLPVYSCCCMGVPPPREMHRLLDSESVVQQMCHSHYSGYFCISNRVFKDSCMFRRGLQK
jgi:hypothetical protein